ncbi:MULTISPECIES: helix-turn-helix domain-containing protein [unclassified Geomicrobium]|uniref:winged helix-turn-helix transcriptional regulator n=1 Tax=unclassified Geomicrobium TaxID=2628951 RepID=UPI00045ED067|nr:MULTISPECIES: helix-turn-helix domain-containing protein [unclassified Geomicrobium]GAJ97234.1 transcriptional regulator, HxlR family [Geomicrobium sp. JCM 19055]GAK06957.1 transcriptional regulator, HxlR family [Geomicrobium sp. JCM 19038]
MKVETMNNIKTTLKVVCGKWKGIILIELFDDSLRFSEIKKRIPEIHHQTLIKQLKELEEDQLISRYEHAVVPPKVEYSITEYGRSIFPLLKEMEQWGKHHRVNVE